MTATKKFLIAGTMKLCMVSKYSWYDISGSMRSSKLLVIKIISTCKNMPQLPIFLPFTSSFFDLYFHENLKFGAMRCHCNVRYAAFDLLIMSKTCEFFLNTNFFLSSI